MVNYTINIYKKAIIFFRKQKENAEFHLSTDLGVVCSGLASAIIALRLGHSPGEPRPCPKPRL